MNYHPYADLKRKADYYYSQGQKDLAADYTIKYADKMSEAYRAGSRTDEALLMAFSGYADATDNLFVLKDARTHNYAVKTIYVIKDDILSRDPENVAAKYQFIKSTAIMLLRGWKYSEEYAWVFRSADTYIKDIQRDAPELFQMDSGRFYVDFYEQLRDKTKKEYNDKLAAAASKWREREEWRERGVWRERENGFKLAKMPDLPQPSINECFVGGDLSEVKKVLIYTSLCGVINSLILYLVFLSPISIISVWHNLHWWSIIMYILGIIVAMAIPILINVINEDVVFWDTIDIGLEYVHYYILSYGLIIYVGLCNAISAICRHLGSAWSYLGLIVVGIIVFVVTVGIIAYYIVYCKHIISEFKKNKHSDDC